MTGWTTEKELSASLRHVLNRFDPMAVYRRIEDASGNLGTFDTFICSKGRCLWMELKVGGPNAMPDMRPGQPGFGSDLLNAGGMAFVLMGHTHGGVRLMWGDTTGYDWRDRILGRWDRLDTGLLDMVFRLNKRT